jgi:hypothetical protein
MDHQDLTHEILGQTPALSADYESNRQLQCTTLLEDARMQIRFDYYSSQGLV